MRSQNSTLSEKMFSLHPPHKHSAESKRKMRIVQIGCVGLGSFVHILCAFSACRIATHRRRQAQPCCRHPSGLYRDPACLSMCSSDIAGSGKQMENKSIKTSHRAPKPFGLRMYRAGVWVAIWGFFFAPTWLARVTCPDRAQ